jgi:hypothetical protein
MIFVVGWDRSQDRWDLFESWTADEPIASAREIRGGMCRFRCCNDAVPGHAGGGCCEVWAAGFVVDDGVITFGG